MAEITSFVAVIIDSEQTGTGVGTVLKQQSEQMRLQRFARAEKAGAKASQMMLIPMMIFIMPAVFIMVFGPVILQFLGQGG
jgi:tight adherence protein C